MPYLSILINIDTRPENNTFGGENLKGCSNSDFWTHGIFNKIKNFEGFDKEIIVIIDEHNPIPDEDLKYIRSLVDCVVIRKHTDEKSFNDYTYLRTLNMVTGNVIIHFDQDTNMFSSSHEEVDKFIDLVNQYDFVSYPSHHSPLPVHDDSFNHIWCSTRYFMCKKSALDLPEIEKCFNYDYWTNKYPVNRKCPWMEHWIGSIAKYRNQSVYYPPMDLDNISIFSWGSYSKYTLMRLNEMSYDKVKEWVLSNGIHYPNDVFC